MLTVKADGADHFEIGTKGLKERGSDTWDSFPIEEPVMLGFGGTACVKVQKGWGAQGVWGTVGSSRSVGRWQGK